MSDRFIIIDAEEAASYGTPKRRNRSETPRNRAPLPSLPPQPTTSTEPSAAIESTTSTTEPTTSTTEPITSTTEPTTSTTEPTTSTTEPTTSTTEPTTTITEPATTITEPATTITEPVTTATNEPATTAETNTITEPAITSTEPTTAEPTATTETTTEEREEASNFRTTVEESGDDEPRGVGELSDLDDVEDVAAAAELEEEEGTPAVEDSQQTATSTQHTRRSIDFFTENATKAYLDLLRDMDIHWRIKGLGHNTRTIHDVWVEAFEAFKELDSFSSFPEDFRNNLTLENFQKKFTNLKRDYKGHRDNLNNATGRGAGFNPFVAHKWYAEMFAIIRDDPSFNPPVMMHSGGVATPPSTTRSESNGRVTRQTYGPNGSMEELAPPAPNTGNNRSPTSSSPPPPTTTTTQPTGTARNENGGVDYDDVIENMNTIHTQSMATLGTLQQQLMDRLFGTAEEITEKRRRKEEKKLAKAEKRRREAEEEVVERQAKATEAQRRATRDHKMLEIQEKTSEAFINYLKSMTPDNNSSSNN
ncbi:hypothetical protein ABG067_007816 [Albugo candida]